MSKLFTEELAPEMVLEKPITDQYGLVLFQQGTVLSAKTINTLRMWGVTEVSIEDGSLGNAGTSPFVSDPEVVAEATAHVEALFRNTASKGSFVRELMRYTIHRLVKHRMEEHTHAG